MKTAGVEDNYGWIAKGFEQGFDIGINREQIKSGARDGFPSLQNGVIKLGENLASAKQWPEAVRKKLAEELEKGRLMGPLKTVPFQTCVISPIGVVPKKEPGKFRLIHHLSYPKGNSVNEAIDKEDKTVYYPSVDDAIESILAGGKDVWLAKTDIKSAFRIVPVHPEYYSALGIMWEGEYYFDRCLPMGCATSCKIFTEISNCLVELFYSSPESSKCINVLDDFLFIGSTKQGTKQALRTFLELCAQIGVPIADEKTEGPEKSITFLGIEIDAGSQEVRLPNDKLNQYVPLLQKTISKSKITCKELQSLAGKLQFACYVVPQGRAFLRRIYNLFGGWDTPLKAHYHIRLTEAVKQDLETWLMFFKEFNGRTMFIRDRRPDKWLTTDASGSIGFGLIFGSEWAYGVWPDGWEEFGITFKEMFPIALVICQWPQQIENTMILCESDNMAVVHTINSFSCKCKHTMVLVRKMVLVALRYNIQLQAVHVPGKTNVLADALSRLQLERFHKEVKVNGRVLAPQPQPIEPLWMDLDSWKPKYFNREQRRHIDGRGRCSKRSW